MMIDVKNTFSQRKAEIDEYFNFLNAYQPANADDNLFKILKSNLLIMLYNLIESSISNAIEEIHNNMYSNSVSFNSLKGEIKSIIISNTKKVNPDKLVLQINDIATDIVKHTFKKDELFSGNVDGKKIREISVKYGFNSDTDYNKTKHGSHLVTIKDKRNDLAHGIFSFTEVGKEYTIQDLEEMKDKTLNYISEILDNIECYLLGQDYLYRQP
ncbi:hypothetical protein AGMMS49982_06320 [Bacteroidia bacterium]|nr:hypothetical protein AGMMS49982_06320 [Bacteroidia bacterium]